MKVAVPNTEEIQKDTAQIFHEMILETRIYLREQGYEVIETESERELSRLLEGPKPFDIILGIRAAGLSPKLSSKYREKGIKIACFWDDIHYMDKTVLSYRHNLFSQCDLLFLPYYRHFLGREEYRDYFGYAVDLPYGATRLCLSSNKPFDRRQDGILLAGFCSNVYPLRSKIKGLSENSDLIDYLQHPGYKNGPGGLVGKVFYDHVAHYKAAIVTSASTNTPFGDLSYPLAKFFEIPACGCIPIFEKIPDLDRFGFEEGVHYLGITEDTYQGCLNPEILQRRDIAQQARSLIIQKHLWTHRCEKILGYLNQL